MIEINKTIGKNLLMLRKNAKLTQLELAEKFNYSDKTISKWENGESLPSIETLYEIASFYNVTLNDLTNENLTVTAQKVNNEKDNTTPTKLIITLLAVSAVWLLATVIFVCLKIVFNINYGYVFIWAVPLSCIVLLVFNSIWGKKSLQFAILTVLIWTMLVSIHVPLASYNIWIIYILGIPLQVAIILWSCLHKNPAKNFNKIIEKTKQIINKNKDKNNNKNKNDVATDKVSLEEKISD